MLLKMGNIGLSVCPSVGMITFERKFNNFWKTNAIGFKFSVNVRDSYTTESYVTENKQGRTVCPSVRPSVRQSGGTITIVKMEQSSLNLIDTSVMAMRLKLWKMGKTNTIGIKFSVNVWDSKITKT